MANKARRMIRAFRNCFMQSCPHSSFDKIYRTCIRPVFTYSMPLFTNISKQGDHEVQRVDRLMQRITGREASWSSPQKVANMTLLRIELFTQMGHLQVWSSQCSSGGVLVLATLCSYVQLGVSRKFQLREPCPPLLNLRASNGMPCLMMLHV